MESSPEALAERVARRLAEVEGIVAITLGGSTAAGVADAHSDLDLGLYYHPSLSPSTEALNAVAEALDDRHPGDAVTAIGEWGPWINGGAWLIVEGRRVDLLFRDLQKVRNCIDDCTAGRVTWHYQPGHPYAFSNAIYLAELHYSLVLQDPAGVIAALKAEVATYPDAMRREIVLHGLFEAAFSLDVSEKPTRRGDSTYVAGCLFRSAMCMAQVLFALNRIYLMNEKGAIARTASFALRPDGFAETVRSVMAAPGLSPRQLATSVSRFRQLSDAVRMLAENAGV